MGLGSATESCPKIESKVKLLTQTKIENPVPESFLASAISCVKTKEEKKK